MYFIGNLLFFSVQQRVLPPPVYAKMHYKPWQCTTYTGEEDNFQTISNAAFPEWITDDTFMGANERIHLRTYFHRACEPFHHERHVDAKKVLYYLVIRNDCNREIGESVSDHLAAKQFLL